MILILMCRLLVMSADDDDDYYDDGDDEWETDSDDEGMPGGDEHPLYQAGYRPGSQPGLLHCGQELHGPSRPLPASS